MRLQVVFGAIGQLARLFSLAFLAPLVVALVDSEWMPAVHFLFSGVLSALIGSLMAFRFEAPRFFRRSEAMAVVAGTWLVVAWLSAVPFMLDGLSPVDAFFESMSGLTTTGATILSDFTAYRRAFFFWRGMIQWVGGVGVIALFVVVLPRIGIGGRQLFSAEASTAPSEGVSPQIRQAASRVWILYVALTVVCTGALMVCGYSLYDAVVHAFTTLAAGGFSPHPLSVAGYANPSAEWVFVVFMLIGGSSFPLQLKALRHGPGELARDSEFVWYMAITTVCAVAIAWVLADGLPGEHSLRAGFFQVASIISTTGYASEDFQLWPYAAKAWLLVPMVVGGCAGSAGGGVKVVRHILMWRQMGREVLQAVHPQAVLPIRYKGSNVPEHVLRAVAAMVTIYVGTTVVSGVALILLGSEPVTAFSASLACIGNIGPGFDVVGPMGSYASFSVLAKLVCTAEMWIGRLEVFTVVALLHPDVWRDMRWR